MDALSQKKSSEAKQHISDAEKSLKTSLFKRKPDLDSAANSYAQAGLCYKIIKDYKNAIECCQKSGDCYSQNGSAYNAAKQYEQCALFSNDIKNYNATYEQFVKATELMITNGTRDSAGILLERGANLLKLNAPDKALQLFQRAIHVADVEDKTHELISLYENAINIAIRIKEFTTAVELIDNSFAVLDKIGSQEQITKYILTVSIIYLSRDDWVSAKNYLDKMKAKYELAPDSRGFGRVDDLLKAYDEKDDDMFKLLIKNYLSYAVDNEVLKIANSIVKSEEWIKSIQEEDNKPQISSYSNQSSAAEAATSSSYNQNQSAAAPAAAAAAADDDEDEESLL